MQDANLDSNTQSEVVELKVLQAIPRNSDGGQKEWVQGCGPLRGFFPAASSHFIIVASNVQLISVSPIEAAVREYLVVERNYPLHWIKASGYWVKGKADTTEKFE
ncbi:hypothetical protein QO004_000493 [Rhizobium mesoamericanum]|nr:hypothetical protein [Rhizobium mesoamericanum]